MPNPEGQEFKPVDIPELPPLPFNPPSLDNFVPTDRLNKERLDFILNTVPEGFLQPREIDLLVSVLCTREKALAFTDAERGSFSREFFPDYEIPVIEHTPWVQDPIRIPRAIEPEVRRLLNEQTAAGKYEYSSASYRSRVFAVAKKGGIRLVQDVQELNKVTVRDAALPPQVDDFAEQCSGRAIYGLADLYAGYNGRTIAVASRPLTTFHSPVGPLRNTALPQGYTNSLPEFQHCTTHVLKEEIPEHGSVFVDDNNMNGPRDTYNNEEIAPGIRRFVYEYATVVDRFLARFIRAGITASGWKFILATPHLEIVGYMVDKDGWHLKHGVVSKILNWPEPSNVSEIRGFLGTAGVGRKWIKGFSLIAKPLTALTRSSNLDFEFGENEREAFETLKQRISEAPVLTAVDYEAAKHVTLLPRVNDDGLLIVAVDSCKNGSGWIILQYHGKEKKPALFGSCTFSETESNYSQPKAELYGVFRALKDLRHRVWGVHFRIDTDAKFLQEMIFNPGDLPNAPMMRWVMYISLFDFELNHVPAEKHQAADGLSRRKRSPFDSDDDDAEAYLDTYINSTEAQYSPPNPIISFRQMAKAYLLGYRTKPRAPYGAYKNARCVDNMTILGLAPPHIRKDFDVGWFSGISYDPAAFDIDRQRGSLIDHSLLKNTDTMTFTGLDFMIRKVPVKITETCRLGDEDVELELTEYRPAYDSSLSEGKPPPCGLDPIYHPRTTIHERRDNQTDYDLVDPNGYIACIDHGFATKEIEMTGMWQEILDYLKDGKLPWYCTEYVDEHRIFVNRTKNFIVHDNRLWRTSRGGKPPRLVITDLNRRRELLAGAHNDVGHRGRDSTYKLLVDRYYWPNMYDGVAYFIRSCNVCQLRSRTRPIIPFSATWNSAILRRFDIDTVHMEKGYGGKRYLMQAIEPSIGWIEARATAKNCAENWARFLYEEIICRFGCIPHFTNDGGPEFKGVSQVLFKQYGAVAVVSSPYHPQGNGTIERAHPTLVNPILKACGTDSTKWPLYVHPALLATRCTTNRMTGYTPYYMLYGKHPILAFEIADRTWDVLDWDQIRTTDDLLAIRAQQILRRDKDVVIALNQQKKARQKSVDDFNLKYSKYLTNNDFELGTWVLAHETWLDNQMGNKGALRWTGPYIVHERRERGGYRLRELDGTVMRDTFAPSRLKIFYYRTDHQTLKTVDRISYAVHKVASGSQENTRPFIQNMFPTVARGSPFPTSVKPGKPLLALNDDLSYYPAFVADNWRVGTHPAIGELAASGKVINSMGRKISHQKIEETNIADLESWAVEYCPTR